MASQQPYTTQSQSGQGTHQQNTQTPGDYWAESPMTRRYSMRFDDQEEQQPTHNALSDAYNGYFPKLTD